MSDTTDDENNENDENNEEQDAAHGFMSISEAVQHLSLSVDVDELVGRGFRTEEILYLLDHCPFVQVTDGDLKAKPYEEVQFITAESGWVIHDYGDAMSCSPGGLLFGGGYRADDDEGGSGGGLGKGTLVRQRYMSARDLVALAMKHGWGSVNLVDGHPRMMRDVWIESQQQGITVIGYKPSEADITVRDRVMMSKDALAVKRAGSSIKRK